MIHPEQDTTIMARKLISYIRFSKKGKQETGDSERRQEELIAQAAREEGVPVDTTITLRDRGMSSFRGQNWHRGDLGKFLDLVDAGIISKGSILCFERVNRASRMPWMQQVQLWKEILSRGIVIRTCDPPARYTQENMDDLAVGCPVVIYMMLGHAESKQKSDWCRQAFAEMKRRSRATGEPHNMRTPGWIRRITAPHPKGAERIITTGYELIPERKALLQWMHKQAQDTADPWGSRRIANFLNESGEPSWHGRKWSDTVVKYLLTTRTAVGEHQPTRVTNGGKVVSDGPPIQLYPAAIDEECWQRTQAARKGRTHRGGRRSNQVRNLFTHLVKDAAAGEPLHIHTQDAYGRRYEYLTLEARRWCIPCDKFEEAILAALAVLRARDVDGRHQADALTDRVDKLQQDRCRLSLDEQALEQQLSDLPSSRWPKLALVRLAEIKDAITETDRLLRQAKELANTSTRTEALTDLQSSLERLSQVRERGTPQELQTLRERIKSRIPLVIESIWVRMQHQNIRRRYVHVRIYLHGGGQRPLVIKICDPTVPPLPLLDADFRGGEERGYVPDTTRRPQLHAAAPAV